MKSTASIKRDRSSVGYAGVGIFVLVSACFALIWMIMVGSYLKLVFSWKQTTGYVAGSVYVADLLRPERNVEYGSIQYSDERGQERRITDKERFSIRGYALHDRVSVYYNPDHSEEARVSPLQGRGFPMVLFTVLMAMLVTVSGFLLKQTMRGVKLVVPRIQWMKWGLSSAALVAANSVPVFGVLFFQWNLFHILLLYWVESGVIGWYAILRQFRGNFAEALGSSFLFLMHLVFFLGLQGLFLITIYGPDEGSGSIIASLAKIVPSLVTLRLAILSFFISYGIAFVKEWREKQTNQKMDPFWAILPMYGRMLFLQIVIVMGGFLVARFHQPVLSLVLLIGMKTFVDIGVSLKREALDGEKSGKERASSI